MRLKSGRLQLRQALPDRITQAAFDAFLARLEETANIRLAAEAVGFAHSSLLGRGRADREFAAAIADALAWAREEIGRAAAASVEAACAPRFPTEAELAWPRGLTVDQALRALGAPPLRLPGSPFPKRRT